jgi:hypothetical protein
MVHIAQRLPVRRAVLAAAMAAGLLFAGGARAAATTPTAPRISVTDLCYEEKVAGFFTNTEYHASHDRSSSGHAGYESSEAGGSGSSGHHSSDRGEVSYKSNTDYQIHIDRGELRKFTSDVKGNLIKAGYKVVQGKPWTQKNTEQLYDVIERIKQGYYPNTDFVLFGSVSSIDARNEVNPIQGSNAVSRSFSVELMAEFSLIDVHTYEVKASFSALGEGSTVRLANSAGTIQQANISRVLQEVSQSLGEAALKEIDAQFGDSLRPRAPAGAAEREPETQAERVMRRAVQN